jgi:hypothetical protein
MLPKPPSAPRPRRSVPEQRSAPHVQAAVTGLLQAKRQELPASRQPAAHVQAALAIQAKKSGAPGSTPVHVQRAHEAVQPKLPGAAAGRPVAPHVRAALGSVQARQAPEGQPASHASRKAPVAQKEPPQVQARFQVSRLQPQNRSPMSRPRVVQPLTNKHTEHSFAILMKDKKIVLYDENDETERGFVSYSSDDKFYLQTIDTKSGKGPKGAGAILVYNLAMLARNGRFDRIVVPNATPEETGFYLTVGFGPDPQFVLELQSTGMSAEKVNELKYTKLSANVNTLLDKAGASVVKNWSDALWDQHGLYAGHHAVHGDMFHIPL